MGWSGESSKVPANAPFVNGGKPLDILELDPQFAQAIGIANGQKVYGTGESWDAGYI